MILIHLVILTALLFLPIFLLMVGLLYLARKYAPEARLLWEGLAEPFLFVPAAVLALSLAAILVQGWH